jgi:hypothetical protein
VIIRGENAFSRRNGWLAGKSSPLPLRPSGQIQRRDAAATLLRWHWTKVPTSFPSRPSVEIHPAALCRTPLHSLLPLRAPVQIPFFPVAARRNSRKRAQEVQRGKPAAKLNWPQENAKITKKKQHKFLSMCSLCSFAAKIFLELRDFSL